MIGGKVDGCLHEVDIWLGDVLLTPVDNMAYLPQFISSMEYELAQLQQGTINPDAFFLDLGPTTDDCSSRIKLNGEFAELTFEIENGVIHFIKVEINELISTYESTINKLRALKT